MELIDEIEDKLKHYPVISLNIKEIGRKGYRFNIGTVEIVVSSIEPFIQGRSKPTKPFKSLSIEKHEWIGLKEIIEQKIIPQSKLKENKDIWESIN